MTKTATNLTVMLCVNDPDTGRDTGRCSNISIQGEGSIDLECQYCDWSPRCYVRGGKLHFSRRVFPCFNETDWVGNWCWNSVDLRPDDAVSLLNYLQKIGWRVDHAETDFFERFNGGAEITLADLRKAIGA